MAILALETSTQMCGVALASFADQGFEMLYERNDLLTRTHSRMLLPMIDSAMREAGVSPGQIEAIGITSGPGSFTGIRIGMATAKGLALAWGVPVITVGTLDVIAMNPDPQALVCPVLDARRGAVYAAVFKRAAASSFRAQPVQPVAVYTPAELLGVLERSATGDAPVVLTGDAVQAVVLAAKTTSLESRLQVYNGDWYPRSGNVARIASVEYSGGMRHHARNAVATYLRRSEAEEKRNVR